MPNNLMKFTAIKGSITINGVALTISHIEQNAVNVSLIPHTLEQTTLGELKTGDLVNIEIDMLARYLKSLLDNKEGQITYEFLRERNFL
jgi:riboflavin synthase